MKENFEADMRDMERKLKEAQDKAGGAADESSDEEDSGDHKKVAAGQVAVDEKFMFEYQQIKAERDAYKK